MSYYSYRHKISTSRGKNAHKLRYIDKALSYLDSELSLIHLRIKHPELFHQSEQQTFQSELYILPKSKDLGIVALGEIVIALFLSKKVFQRNGKPAYLNQIADVFEKLFNCSFGSIYDQQEKVFDRKPFNRTKALDFLRNLIIQKDKEGKK
ncbi:RteC domain-containing protein [Dysgonomonas sp. ZJ279]|uniref:RteC domain-containing protein n=1 Tax=Dysgonomonas sp. ZJ279 TaxID=2709796 RepID=UPI0013EA3088|nr:RteC domain-containing protein [Dysgonomonas sp. ZJ279]